MNSIMSPQAFTVIRFEPSNIILQHNSNRKLYSYHQIEEIKCYQPNSPLILKAEPLGGGFVSEKQLTDLGKCLQPKIQSRVKVYYEQVQLQNTFEGILDYLQSGQKYQNLAFQNILVDSLGSIRLKDPRLIKPATSKANGYKKLGSLLLQCATLKSQQEVAIIGKQQRLLASELKGYSSKFKANIWILLHCSDQFCKIVDLSQKQVTCQGYKQIIQQMQKASMNNSLILSNEKSQKITSQKKTIIIPPLNLNLKLSRIQKPEVKLQLSGKSKNRNENFNEQQILGQGKKIGKTNNQAAQKMFNSNNQASKQTQARQAPLIKLKRAQYAENLENSIKKRGKTMDKKLKFQQRGN